MNKTKKLESTINIRIPLVLRNTIEEMAKVYGLKSSTFARCILLQQIRNYDKNRLWG